MRRFRVGAVQGALFAVTLVAGTVVAGAAASATSGGTASSTHATAGTSGTSGSVTSAQPLSSADQNPGGANNGGKCGSYCSTRNGTASANGSGSGGGRPCAGCVGKADNKNPSGQAPSGGFSKAAGDPNNGYECDGNNGIARGNPAHTGCTLSAPTPGGGAAVTPPPPRGGGATGTPGPG